MLLLFLKDQENLRREFHEFRRRLKDRPNDGFDASSEADFEQILIELDQLQEAYTAELQRRRDLVSPAKGSAAVSRVDRETRAELDRLQATFSAVLERQRNRGGNSRIAGPSLEKIPFEITTEDLICYVEGSLRDDPARRRLIEYSICNDHEIFEEYQHLQERIFGGRSSGLENPEPALGDKKIANRSSKRDESFEGDSFIRPERIPYLAFIDAKFHPGFKSFGLIVDALGRLFQVRRGRFSVQASKILGGQYFYLADSEGAVFALCEILRDPELHAVESLLELEKIRRNDLGFVYKENFDFWCSQAGKLKRLLPGEKLNLLEIRFKIVAAENYLVPKPKGAKDSWISLERHPEYYPVASKVNDSGVDPERHV